MRIIPAIDLIEGKCVRLTQGDYQQKKVYNERPLEVARQFEDAGLQYLHLVDLDGARQKKIINYKVLEQIASSTRLHIDFGGGIQSDEDLHIAFSAGAQQVTAGSVAVKKPELLDEWLKKFGSEKIILGADVKNKKIAISGWQENTEVALFDFLKAYVQKNIQYAICTDVSKDGLLQGTAHELYQEIMKEFPELLLIASGGVSNIKDLEILQQINTFGVIIGKAIYEGKIQLNELQKFYS